MLYFPHQRKKSETWSVKGYTVYLRQVIGQGACGIVYRGQDSKGNKIAAKPTDTKKERFTTKDHEMN